ncbi:uncharacterized protein [Rutidosis leptorrhynchoides]|uniref:uncharacterized protein isoform X3 n=1 Tax=Rutidosis leptorrhynchoides TaxID=125765 RepID=UPI003A9A365B
MVAERREIQEFTLKNKQQKSQRIEVKLLVVATIDLSVEDAQKICRAIIDCFETASLTNMSDDDRNMLCCIGIVL